MAIYDLPKFVGWFLATDISWDEDFPALHYVSDFIVNPVDLSGTLITNSREHLKDLQVGMLLKLKSKMTAHIKRLSTSMVSSLQTT